MCGLFGVLTTGREPTREIVEKCHVVQGHRGPDGRGELIEEVGQAHLLFAHQRLAIIDLSPAARQPMEDAAGRGAIVFNGELFNYLELRKDLEAVGQHFRTDSDTEVLLTALHHWGLESALARFNWMGAFAWIDRLRRRMVLARDPFGEKPLYIYRSPGMLLFASELKTVLHLAGRRFPLEPGVVTDYLVHGLIHTSESSIFSGIVQLPAGHYLSVNCERPESGEPRCYFRLESSSESTPDDPDAFAELVRSLVLDAVRLRLRSDVPVGVLLSGGLDSSMLAAAAVQNERKGPEVQLLSAVSDDPASDESPFIDLMATHLHRSIIKITLAFDPITVANLLEEVSWYNDHPVCYLGDLYHYLLMQQARSHGITVILSGQGADELFCGYLKYSWLHLLALLRTGQPFAAFRWLWQYHRNGLLSANFQPADAKRYLRQLLPGMGVALGPDVRGPTLLGTQPADLGVHGTDIAQRQALDLQRLSVPGLCHIEDRVSMAFSCEVRLPYLDPPLARIMLAASLRHKLHGGWTKYSLRRAAAPLVPKEIAWRRDKRGFTVPEGPLLRGPTGDLIERYMTPDSLVFQQGLVNRERWLALFRRFRSQQLGAALIPSREVWAPWALEVWMRGYQDWLAMSQLGVNLAPLHGRIDAQ
jgi:asparagine synthase (glutamine-hydrolysing)